MGTLRGALAVPLLFSVLYFHSVPKLSPRPVDVGVQEPILSWLRSITMRGEPDGGSQQKLRRLIPGLSKQKVVGKKQTARSRPVAGVPRRWSRAGTALELVETFRIADEVNGTVRCKNRLIVVENASCKGELEGAIGFLAGKINGSIHVTNGVVIPPRSSVEGAGLPPFSPPKAMQ